MRQVEEKYSRRNSNQKASADIRRQQNQSATVAFWSWGDGQQTGETDDSLWRATLHLSQILRSFSRGLSEIMKQLKTYQLDLLFPRPSFVAAVQKTNWRESRLQEQECQQQRWCLQAAGAHLTSDPKQQYTATLSCWQSETNEEPGDTQILARAPEQTPVTLIRS